MNPRAEIDSADQKRIVITVPFTSKDLVKQLPGSTWSHKEQAWKMPLGWSACITLRAVFGPDLEIGPKLTEWAQDIYATRIGPALALRDSTEREGDPTLYPFQRAGVAFLDTAERALLADEMGCLTGDTEIQLERGGGTRRVTLSKLYEKWTQTGGKKRWDLAIPSRVKSMFPDGQLRLNRIENVLDKGIRPVMTVTLESGRSVTCTYDHEIACPGYEWTAAEKLQVGDEVLINGTPCCARCGGVEDVILGETAVYRGYCRECMYKYLRRNPKFDGTERLDRGEYLLRIKQWDHPNANRFGHVPVHVLVMTEYLGRGMRPDEVIHHKNHDKLDNRLENLEVLTRAEHSKHHGDDNGHLHLNGASGRRGEIWFIPKTDRVTKIEDAGEQRVYDLVMADPARNFVANGIVVHNSGKTIQTIKALQLMHLNGKNVFPVLVVCPNSMKKTWQREADKWWPGLTFLPVSGSAGQRRKILETPAHGFIMNWESLRGHSRLAPYGSIALKRCKECGGEDLSITPTQCHVHPRELQQLKFQTVVADECFTADVIISTPDGDRKISELQPGDRVYGYNHQTKQVTVETVTATMQRDAASVVRGWDATPNHPVYVTGEGYRPIGDLAGDDGVITLCDVPGVRNQLSGELPLQCGRIETQEVLLSDVRKSRGWSTEREEYSAAQNDATPPEVRVLRPQVPTALRENQVSLLREELQLEGVCASSGGQGAQSGFCAEDDGESRGSTEADRVLGQRPQRIQADSVRETAGDREIVLAQHGVWSSLDEDHAGRDGAVVASSSAFGKSPLHDDRRGIASLLPSGHLVSGGEGDRGSGWLGASRAEGVRRPENSSAGETGIRRYPILELRDPERYERVCAEGALPVGGEARVYSLTTTSGNYFAHGVLVRNCHRAKDPKSQQTRALWAATGIAPYRFALTGTPIANAPDDLWPIMHWLDPAQFPSRTRWIDRFCEVMYNAFGAPTVIGIKPEREAEFQAIINPMMRRMPKSLVLPFLPPIVRERREVEMSPKQAKAYKQMSEQMIAELENGDTLIAASPLVKATRLIQFSSAFAELQTETKADGTVEVNVRLSDPSCKIDAFMDDLPDFMGKSVVVFAQSKQLINLLSDRLSKQKKPIPHGLITGDQSTDERQKHMDDFQAGKTNLILCTVQAGGTGITLTKGSMAVFLQRSWSLVDTKQAEARIHRIGSEMHESVTILDYVTTGTIEEFQIEALTKKNSNLEAVVRDAELLKRVLMRQAIDEDEAVDAQ